MNKSDTITLSKTSFVKLIDLISRSTANSGSRPSDDAPSNPKNPLGPYGPGGPVLRYLIAAGFNPSEIDAREVIDRAFSQYQFAEMLGDGEQSEKIISVTRSQIQEFVDEYCGNGRPKWPRPRKLDAVELQPIDLIVAGIQFQKMADLAVDNPLSEDLSAAADKLLEVGLNRLEQ
jgi:hypothetical protein